MGKKSQWTLMLMCLLPLLHSITEAADCSTFTQKAIVCVTQFVVAQGDAFVQSCKIKCSDFDTATRCINDIQGRAECVGQVEEQINQFAKVYNLPCTLKDMQVKCPNGTRLVIPGTTAVAKTTVSQAQAALTSGLNTHTTEARVSVTVGNTRAVGNTEKSVSGTSRTVVGDTLSLTIGTLFLVLFIS